MRTTALIILLMVFHPVGPIAYAEPVKLTDSDLDAITAGAVYVSADAGAVAIGDGAFAAVNTETQTGEVGIVEWGYARASALACCGPQTDADVSLNASGDGPYVATLGIIDKKVGVGLPPGSLQYTTATGFVVVVSIDPSALGLLRNRQNTGERSWTNSALIARLVRPQLGRPMHESSDRSTNERGGTVAYGSAASHASGLNAAAALVSSFATTLPNFSAAAARSISFRD